MTQEVPVGVIAAFKKGSSTELSNYLGDKVDLVIQNRPAASDKQGAVQSLMRLFTDNKVSNFNVNHQGKRDESSFIIGTLTTDKGNFRVNCFFKKVQNRYIIHQIRIDKSND
jgi:hypothetical protein